VTSLYDTFNLATRPADAAMHAVGFNLVATGGPGPADILWDADEVLWDWAMPFGRMLSVAPKVLVRRYGHREWIAIRPGMIGLLAGLHDGAVAGGRDPWMRIWTAGYPWRLWRIFQEIPEFMALIGPGLDDGGTLTPESLRSHPRVMARGDLINIILALLDDDQEQAIMAKIPASIRPLVAAQMRENPGHGGFKIPELAAVAGKPEIAGTRILVDDTRANIEWFVASGRSAVWVESPTPRVLFGKVPNSLWFRPDRWLGALDHGLVPAIARALGVVGHEGRIVEANSSGDPDGESSFPRPSVTERVFPIEIPNKIFWREWFGPMKTVKKAARARQRRQRAALKQAQRLSES